MDTSQGHHVTDWREGRRLLAWRLFGEGMSQRQIAQTLQVTEGAVSQWIKAAHLHGEEGLYRRIAPGPTPKLSAEQQAVLPDLLARGPAAYGFEGEVWTRSRVAAVIAREFGVQVSVITVGRILKACGWSWQKPVRRAKQRDEAAISAWREKRWPEIEKKV